MKKKKAKKELENENVAVPKELITKIKYYKEKTGISIKFFVTQAINEKLAKPIEADKLAEQV